MFELLPLASAATVGIEIDGDPLRVPAHFTVAAALLANGPMACRTSAVSGAPRGPFCMMGVCFECLVEIDGVPNVQACMTRVAEGMRVRSMQGKARLA
ncbi:(2Fe-2S)-binding protein [Paraburkholderia diazotrophica]|uniref:2Fe-2S iron-sulfur cluster binding domain-containing protein n=1 Tax=Paraburkholderia diazotrophica TaxID=667676 RepID=A0A1H7EEX0_9BURK|nr:(2Fe-2S)-binding protein [Paraburkholderia diazotrophica]SEK10612.1 2Fe-2S iron-sulfur cluster binding domain-containing protein [Paraburkholderia diazotrophica]